MKCFKRLFAFILITFFPLCASAQWRIGVTVGETYNHLSIDNHYMSDLHHENAWGRFPTNRRLYIGTFGVMGQYDINDWFGIRTDINLTLKDHRQYRTLTSTDYHTSNSYIQMPVMANFCFGSNKFRGFLNTGVYAGYWCASYDDGYFQNIYGILSGVVERDFNSERD